MTTPGMQLAILKMHPAETRGIDIPRLSPSLFLCFAQRARRQRRPGQRPLTVKRRRVGAGAAGARYCDA
jgi:hypothetical protein